MKSRIESIVAGAGELIAEETYEDDEAEPIHGNAGLPVTPSRAPLLAHPNWTGISVILATVLTVVAIILSLR